LMSQGILKVYIKKKKTKQKKRRKKKKKKRQYIVQSTVAEYTNFISQLYSVSLQMVMVRDTAPAGEQTH